MLGERIIKNREKTMKKEQYLLGQQAKYRRGQIDRRQFITSVIAAGLAVPAALGLASSVEAATPTRGGLFKIGRRHGSTTDSLDPATYENGYMQNLCYSYGNHLTEVGADGKLRGELAETYESSDAQTWVFNLRKGVEFHNGKTLDADDVIATFNHHMGEDSKSAGKGLLSAITSIKADGPNRVVFELNAPNADFPFIVSDYHIVILPASGGQIDPTAGIGTGGYIIENHEPGVRTLMKRNPNYWKENAAYFDEIEKLALLDVTARQNAIMNGDVHAIDGVDPKTVALLG